MKKPFLFKRGKYYHFEYFDEYEQRIKRVSTGEKIKSDALKFLTGLLANKKNETPLTFITLSEFTIEYEKHIETNLSKAYLIDVKLTFKKLLNNIGDIPLKKISPRLVEQFISNEANKTKVQAKKCHANLRSAFNKAVSWGYLSSNPTTGIKPPKVPKNNPIFINETELKQILYYIDIENMKDIYLLAYHSGMRLGEIINLRWNHVQLKEKIIQVINTSEFTTKGKKERVIPINETLFSLLQKRIPKVIHIQFNDYVFTKNGFKYNGDYISRKFKKAVRKTTKELPINPALHFHDLRHSFASNLVKKGVSLYVVKELLGHKDISTTMIYSHLTVDTLRQAVKVLEN